MGFIEREESLEIKKMEDEREKWLKEKKRFWSRNGKYNRRIS